MLASGAPISTVIGHAAPFVVDLDGDGKRDLVVGMFGSDAEDAKGGGTARFYRNVGTNQGVLASVCAIGFSIELGFSAVLMLGVAFYLLAWLVLRVGR